MPRKASATVVSGTSDAQANGAVEDPLASAKPARPSRAAKRKAEEKISAEMKRNGSAEAKDEEEETGDWKPEEKKEEEKEKPVASKKKSTKKSEVQKSAAKTKIFETVKKHVFSGRAPVDPECKDKLGKAHVYEEGADVYDAMLNQTNIGTNNNKYYILQLLEDDDKKVYSVWFRWGRIGYRGQNTLIRSDSLDAAKETFCAKFLDKTRNEWGDRRNFEKVHGKYDLVEIDYAMNAEEGGKAGASTAAAAAADENGQAESERKLPESKLDIRIQNLMKLICDMKMMEAAVREMQYDAEKAPLGKLTVGQINAGYAALQKVEDCLERKDRRGLEAACSEFYTRIPHDFGFRTPPVIGDKQTLKEKIQLLEALQDIQVAIKTLKSEAKDETINPLDRHYDAMECQLEPVEAESAEYKLINDYLQNTHAPTHTGYKMNLVNLYKCTKLTEEEFEDVGNKMLLWHGSRLTNWYGILRQSLRVAPPEAPVTGYMFGKGIYFADMSSKSANYCFASNQQPKALLVLCEVALGKTNDLIAADYQADKLPKGCHSTKGLGEMEPDSKAKQFIADNVMVPCGKPVKTGVKNPAGYTLNYNEYVVYATRQVRMRYLVEIDFQFDY